MANTKKGGSRRMPMKGKEVDIYRRVTASDAPPGIQKMIAEEIGVTPGAVSKAVKKGESMIIESAPGAIARQESGVTVPQAREMINRETDKKREHIFSVLTDLIDKLDEKQSLDSKDVKAFVSAVSAAEKILKGWDESRKMHLTYNDMRIQAGGAITSFEEELKKVRYDERNNFITQMETFLRAHDLYDDFLRVLEEKESWEDEIKGDVIDVEASNI